MARITARHHMSGRSHANAGSRRGIAAIAVTTFLGFGSLIAAQPAHAATVTVTATCSGGVVDVVGSNDVIAYPGDTVVIQNTTGSNLDVQNLSGFTNNTTIAGLATGTQTSRVVQSATGGFDLIGSGGSPCTTGASVTFGPASSSSAPPSVTQQFGRPATGTCDDAAPVTLNWSGVASGGWSESWAQWMNAGAGGPVCTRNLVYRLSSGSWTVG